MTNEEALQIVSILETHGFKRISEYLQKKHLAAYSESKQSLHDKDYHTSIKNIIIASAEMNLIDEIFKMIEDAKKNAVKK